MANKPETSDRGQGRVKAVLPTGKRHEYLLLFP
jgi:hypothetical protein